MGEEHAQSDVVDIRDSQVLDGGVVNRYALANLLGMGVQILTGAGTTSEAWKKILGDAGKIVIKFNQVGAATLRTNETMATALLSSLEDAGYGRRRVRVAELGPTIARELGVEETGTGWRPGPVLRGRQEDLASYLFEADAVINVPLLKTHQIAGMSCSVKNLAYGLLRRPAAFHDGGCAPYAGEVIGHHDVSRRLRINIVNALRAVVRHGPDAHDGDIIGHGGLLIGYDPVAVDAVGMELLTNLRRRAGELEALTVPHLVAAAQLGVGRAAPHEVVRRPHILDD